MAVNYLNAIVNGDTQEKDCAEDRLIEMATNILKCLLLMTGFLDTEIASRPLSDPQKIRVEVLTQNIGLIA